MKSNTAKFKKSDKMVESFFPVEPRYTPQIYSILFQKEVVL